MILINYMSKKGRPKKYKEFEELTFVTFQQDITMFRDSLIDYINDDNEDLEEDENPINKATVAKFLNLELWEQNIFIVYLINKDKRIKNGNQFTFKALADLLNVERRELMSVIKEIKQKIAI